MGGKRADGTVLVLSPGHEMGQGLFTKVRQAAAMALSEALPRAQRPFPLDLVNVADNSSDLLPNAGALARGYSRQSAVGALIKRCGLLSLARAPPPGFEQSFQRMCSKCSALLSC